MYERQFVAPFTDSCFECFVLSVVFNCVIVSVPQCAWRSDNNFSPSNLNVWRHLSAGELMLWERVGHLPLLLEMTSDGECTSVCLSY